MQAMAPDSRTRSTFASLIGLQAAHSIEECWFRLFDVFTPARLVGAWVGRLVGSDTEVGFIVGNVVVVAFGVWCYTFRVRSGHPHTRVLLWGWALAEMANGFVHTVMAIFERGYFPGLVTAPLLLIAAGTLLARLLNPGRRDGEKPLQKEKARRL